MAGLKGEKYIGSAIITGDENGDLHGLAENLEVVEALSQTLGPIEAYPLVGEVSDQQTSKRVVGNGWGEGTLWTERRAARKNGSEQPTNVVDKRRIH